MPPKPTQTIETEVYLRTSDDWEKWFARLRDLAKRKRVWQYYDPNATDGLTFNIPTPLTVDLTLAAINDEREEEY